MAAGQHGQPTMPGRKAVLACRHNRMSPLLALLTDSTVGQLTNQHGQARHAADPTGIRALSPARKKSARSRPGLVMQRRHTTAQQCSQKSIRGSCSLAKQRAYTQP